MGEMEITPSVGVTLLGPDESGSPRRLNLFLFKVQENPHLKNQDWELSAGNSSRISPPPLSLNLTYLVTPYATNDAQTGNTPAHEILGEAMRVLYEFPVVPDQYLEIGLREAAEQIKIIQVPVDLEELSQVWGTFKQAFRTSVLYEISVVQLDQAPEGGRPVPRRVRQIGVPKVGAPFSPPIVENVVPVVGRSGTVVRISGKHLKGWRAYVTLSNRPLADGVSIAADDFAVTIPAGLATGFHQMRVNISHLCRRTLFFEIVP